MRRGFIYAIQAEKTSLVKIGFSADPETRMATLQTSSPHKLSFIGCWPGSMGTEQRIHAKLEQYRREGEWFEACPLLVIETCQRATAVRVSERLSPAPPDPATPRRYRLEVARSVSGNWCFRLRWSEKGGIRPTIPIACVTHQVYKRIRKGNYEAFKQQVIASHVESVIEVTQADPAGLSKLPQVAREVAL